MSNLKKEKIFTDKQGQYLAYIYYYSKVNRMAPSQRDIQNFFAVSPSTVHQMVLQLEKKELIERTPNKARSFIVLLSRDMIPELI